MTAARMCRLFLGLLLVGANACDSPPTPGPVMPTALPTLPPLPPAEQVKMYAAVADLFFAGPVQDRLQSGWHTIPVIYLQPTFNDMPAPVPAAVLDLLTAHAQALGLTVVPTEQKGGLVLSVTAVKRDPQNGAQDHLMAPIISVVVDVSGGFCMDHSTSYWLASTGTVWEATEYSDGLC